MLDELKPDVLAPGVNVLSADGDLLSDGTHWQRLSGTSMATAFVSGVCALLRESAPDATPAQIAEWLRASARRPLPGVPAGTGGADPRWSSTRGFGLLDAYAASLERAGGSLTQIRRLALTGADTTVTATIWTGRENGVANLVFERASDHEGAAGTFVPVDSLPATGSASLDGPVGVNQYVHTWSVPEFEHGVRFWYRAAWTQLGQRYASPALAFTSPGGARIATLEITLVHDALDSDIEAMVRAGFPPDHGPKFQLPGTACAVASDWVNGASFTGDQSWTFRIPVPAADADSFVPPAPGRPWTLSVAEGGSLTHSGRVSDFRLIWHAPGGDQTFVGQPLPQPTVEGSTVEVRIPADAAGVTGPGARGGARVLPNPARSGRVVRFTLAREAGNEARVFDLGGREVARIALVPNASGWEANWPARDERGRALPPGVYLVRGRSGAALRFVLLDP